MRPFRTRLVISFVAVVTATVLVLGVGSYLFVANSLRERLVEEAVAQARFNVAVLAAERLSSAPDTADFEASGLPEAFRLRGGEVFVDFHGGDPYASRFGFRNTLDLVSSELRRLVDEGRLGYEWVRVEDAPYLVAAARRPPDGPDFYFFFPASGVETALLRLREALVAGGLLLVAAAGLTGGLVAGRVLRPVRRASRAAGRMARGDLSVRLPVESDDEFGAWAASFNRMARALEEKLAELEQAYADQRRFVADVSHELRTPLTALTGAASMLETQTDRMDPDQRQLAELLIRDLRRLRGMVEDLLEISRLDAASEEPEPARLELRPFLEAVIRTRHPAADLRAEAVSVETDRHRLERIVGNLLDNARRHAPDTPASVDARLSGDDLVVEVADRGPGVPEAQLSRIFERFTKAERSRRGDGSGLGLAIARQHARLLGGELTARLREGGGMVFLLRIPVTGSLPARDPTVTGVDDAESVRPADRGEPT